MLKKVIFALSLVFALTASAAAQDVEVDRYNVTARIDLAASALDARATLAISNLSASPKSKLYLRLTKLAKVSAATIGGATAQVEIAEDRRVATINQVIITPQTAIAAGANANLEIAYRIEAPESSGLISVYPGEVLMTPESTWFPIPSTIFTLYGATTAPFTLSVTVPAGSNLRVASAGALKTDSGAQTFTYEQPLNSVPFFVATSFDQPVITDRGGVKIEIHAQPGLAAEGEALRRLSDEAGRIVDFLTKILGPPPTGAIFRIISSVRAGNIIVPGALVLNEQILRQAVLDTIVIERLSDAIARLWIDGRVRLRGQDARSAQADRPGQKGRSPALLRESLPRYLTALYLEERFGKEAGREAFTRMRWAYTPVAQSGRDVELSVQTIALPNYTSAVLGKGPLVLRLMAQTAGRDKFLAAIKQLLAGPQTKTITLDDWRKAFTKDSPEVDKQFQQWIETIIEPDIVIGVPLPSDKPGAQRINIRNLGTGELTVPMLAVTASGKQLTGSVTVPSEDITSIEVQTAEKITSVEVDPEKLLIQSNYDNDVKPVRVSAQTLFNESIIAFNKAEYAQAETKLKEAVRLNPQNSLLHAWLARTLAAQNKMDEATSAANAAIKIEPPGGAALAWAHITLGQAALARNQAAEAVQHLRLAVAEAEEAPAQFAAREMLIRAERAANINPQVEESVRAFFTQLDTLIKQPSSEKLFTVVTKNNLKRFVQGLTVTPPTSWTTEILRADRIDANRVAVDVGLKVKAGGRDQSGTAVFVLYRAGSGWMLEDVNLFNVK